ncbi:MAG: AAA family ATPase [Candidatus Tectomicrobia bacterium]|nr:AAA family ATPase [Candidatus Tectomicrobia bacterium]
MILVIGGTKGGAGKTLLATNLTVMRVEQGRDVLLIDADDQASATFFTRQRKQTKGEAGYTAIQSFEEDVVDQVQNLKPKYDDIVIDVGGRDTASQRAALAVAETFVMPFPPTSVDLWTDDNVITLLKEARPFNPNLHAYAVINKAFSSGSDNADAAEMLREHPDYWQYLETPIGNRKAFSTAFGKGLAISEASPRDAKALAEMTALYAQTFERTDDPSTTRGTHGSFTQTENRRNPARR